MSGTLSVVVLTAVLALQFSFDAAAQQGRVAGAVLSISGPAFIRLAGASTETKLDPKKDVGRVLFEGDTLRSGARGTVRVKTVSSVHEIREDDGTLQVRLPEELSQSQLAVLNALRAYGRPGGTRGGTSGFYWPSEGRTVRRERFHVRWATPDMKGPATMILRASNGMELWRRDGIDAAAGRLPDAEERSVLATTGDHSDSGEYLLTLRDGKGSETRVTFRMLTSGGEAKLAAALAAWETETEPLLRAIGRAHAFETMNLLNDAAAELDAALATASGSTNLRRAAIAAHRRVGDFERAKELADGGPLR
jgi:hypothetical protein